ncbi:11332_t:CDS:2, partial [Scutellospora calospora]
GFQLIYDGNHLGSDCWIASPSAESDSFQQNEPPQHIFSRMNTFSSSANFLSNGLQQNEPLQYIGFHLGDNNWFIFPPSAESSKFAFYHFSTVENFLPPIPPPMRAKTLIPAKLAMSRAINSSITQIKVNMET